jgi:hypothetical protein
MESKGIVITQLLIFADSHCLLAEAPLIELNEHRTAIKLRSST